MLLKILLCQDAAKERINRMKPSGIGGQAVIEGVMMKNKNQYAVAVRKPDNEIVVEINNYVSKAEKIKLFKLPIFRGMLAFVESLAIGSKILTLSASIYEEEEAQKESKVDKAFSKVFKDKAESIIMGITLILAIFLTVGLFILLPGFVANLLSGKIESPALTAVVEGLIRIVLFIIYAIAISRLKEIKRIFMYHGAEHKTINCLEQGFELTVENVKWQSRENKRCGTSFVSTVILISIILFIFIRFDAQWLRYSFRILLIPIVAGVSYELIRLMDKSQSNLVSVLNRPGTWFQSLTIKEPDDEMIEVAIKSVEAVFNWKDYLGIGDTNENVNTKKERTTKQSKKKNTMNRAKQSKDTLESNKAASSGNSKNRNRKSATNTSSNDITKATSRNNSKRSLLMEEDDEILRALEDIVASKEESIERNDVE